MNCILYLHACEYMISETRIIQGSCTELVACDLSAGTAIARLRS